MFCREYRHDMSREHTESITLGFVSGLTTPVPTYPTNTGLLGHYHLNKSHGTFLQQNQRARVRIVLKSARRMRVCAHAFLCTVWSHKGYFHSTMLMQAFLKGFVRVKKKRDRAGRGLPPVACIFFNFSLCFLFSSSSFMMNDVNAAIAGSPLAAILSRPGQSF